MRAVFLVGLFATPLFAQGPDKPAAGKHKMVAYSTEWSVYQRKYNVPDIPADKLTHINYAFAKINEKGECALFDSYAAIDKFYAGDTWDAGVLRGNFKQLQVLRKKHPHLKTLISVGGWTLSGPFSDAALTEKSRVVFARSCVDFMVKYGFDGVDIDWEYPCGGGLPANKTRPEDKRNYTLLLERLRADLDEQGKKDSRRYLLTIAAPAGPATYKNLEIGEIARILDWINLMTYDFHGGWDAQTGFHSALFACPEDPSKDDEVRTKFNLDAAVQAYLKAGCPPDKLVAGVPFYGRGWAGVPSKNDGMFEKATLPLPPGTWEAGVFDYKDLAANYLGKFKRHWHDQAKAPWLYSADKKILISYEDPESLAAKARYIRDHKLGGVMFWELSADDRDNTLVRTLQSELAR